jgi:multiple sugar transport system permease protein
MRPRLATQLPLFLLLCGFTAVNLTPVIWGVLTSIKQPVDAFSVPPKLIFTPTFEFHFVDVPHELYEAAAIDGCNAWQVFARVALPVVRPGLWVTALFSLLLAYNEFLFALVLTGPDTKTLPVAIAEYGGEDINYWSLSAAAAVGIMLPIVAFMMALQRHLARGLAFGAIKG